MTMIIPSLAQHEGLIPVLKEKPVTDRGRYFATRHYCIFAHETPENH